MANIKITELNDIGSLASNDVLVAVDISADETHKITTTNLFRTLPDGTAAAPALAFSDDGNTGIFTPAENQLSFSTGGTQRLRINSSGDVIISGNLQVDGATTTVQSTTVTIDDKNIELGSVASPSNTTADGGGITLKGATDKTIKWINSTGYWTFNTGIEVGGHLQIDDNNEIRIGTAADLVIRHNGADTIFENDLGHVYFSNYADDKDLTFRSDNGSGGITNYVVCDGSSGQVKLYTYGVQKLNTKSDGINVTGDVQCDSLDVDGAADISGNVTLHGNLDLQDNDILRIGTSDDLKLFHDGSNSYIADAGTGNLSIQSDGGEIQLAKSGTFEHMVRAIVDGAVSLYHNGSKKFETKSDGIDVTGEVQSDSLDVDGNVDIDGGTFIFNASSNYFKLTDSTEIRLGSGSDLKIKHDGTNSFITNLTGELKLAGKTRITNDINTESMAVFVPNAEVSLFHNNSVKFQTKSDGIDVTGEVQCDSLDVDGAVDITGTVTLHGNLDLQDNDKILIGTGDDLEIFHNATHSVIADVGTGNLQIRAGDFRVTNSANTETLIVANSNEAVKLYYDNSRKLETKSDGVDVNGEVQCDSLDVDGVADITGDVTLHGNLDLQDDDRLRIGSSDDLQLRHNGTDSHLQNDTGTLFLTNYANDKDITLRTDNGSGDVSNYIVCDGSDGKVRLYQYGSQKLETKSSGINVTGEAECDTLFVNAASGLGTTAGNSQDLAEFRISNSNSSKLRIIEKRDANGTDWNSAYTRIQKTIDTTDQGYIQFNGSGQSYGIEIGTQADEKFATFVRNGAAELYYDNSKKFVTKSDGIDVTGEVQCDSLDVDGAVDITGNAILRSGINTNGEDVYTSNGAIVINDAGGAFSDRNGSNIDHFWHNDTTNTWHFCSDTTYKNQGNSNIKGANVYIADLLIHASDTNTHIGFPANDTFAVTTDNTERFRVTSTGALAFAGASNYGSAGQVLKSTGNGAPSWQDIGSVAVGGASAITMNDNVNINFGNSSDMKLFHDGTNSLLVNEVGAFTIRQNANDSDVVIKSDDGAGGIADYLRCDGSNGTVRFYKYGSERAYTMTDGFDVVGELQCDSLDVDGEADFTGTVTFHSNLDLQDNDTILMGSSDDFKLFHNGSNSHVQNYTGGIYIDQHTNDNDIHLRSDDGSGGITTYVLCDGSTGSTKLFHYGSEKLATQTYGINVQGEVQCDQLDVDGSGDITGTLTLHGNLDMQDNDVILLGSGNDLQIYHSGSNSYIADTGAGALINLTNIFSVRNAADTEQMIHASQDGDVELYYNGSKKLNTKSNGVLVDGEIYTTTLKAFNTTATVGGVLLNSNGSIELHQAAHVPFIDFKSSEAEDFDCRIQSTGTGLMFFTGGNGSTGERWRIRGNGSLSAVGGAGTYKIHLAGGSAGTSNSGIAANWATHSDYRLKENVSNISGAIETVKALRPVNFNWIEDETDTVVQGFLAHELQEQVSNAVIGEKDAVFENGEIDAQSADYSKVVPVLTAALKDAIAKIETLEAKVAALEAS